MSEHDNETRGRGNKPMETLRDGALKLSIFRNTSERGESYSMVPGRIYTDKETGQIREASSLAGSEPLRMAHLLTKGHDRVSDFREQAKREKSSGRDRDDNERER